MGPFPSSALSPSFSTRDRKSTRLNSSHTEIYTLSLHDALPICDAELQRCMTDRLHEPIEHLHGSFSEQRAFTFFFDARSEEHTSELQSHRDLHSFPTRRSSDL